MEEIKTLLQGVELLKVDLCATQPLLPSSDRPTESTTMNNLMVFEEMPDNTGLAQVRRRHQVTASPNEDSHSMDLAHTQCTQNDPFPESSNAVIPEPTQDTN